MNATTFWQLYDALCESLFVDMSLYRQLTLIIRGHARAVTTLQRPDKGWEGVIRYYIQRRDGLAFIVYDKKSGKWGPVFQDRVIPTWDDEELFKMLADPSNLVIIPFFDVVDLVTFSLLFMPQNKAV